MRNKVIKNALILGLIISYFAVALAFLGTAIVAFIAVIYHVFLSQDYLFAFRLFFLTSAALLLAVWWGVNIGPMILRWIERQTS